MGKGKRPQMGAPVNLVITFVDALYITSTDKMNVFAGMALARTVGDMLRGQLACESVRLARRYSWM